MRLNFSTEKTTDFKDVDFSLVLETVDALCSGGLVRVVLDRTSVIFIIIYEDPVACPPSFCPDSSLNYAQYSDSNPVPLSPETFKYVPQIIRKNC